MKYWQGNYATDVWTVSGNINWLFVVLLFSCSRMSDSLWPHELQHARLSCPSLCSTVCSNSYPLSQWCHPTISFYVTHFFCLYSFPAWGFFPVSQLFASGGQSVETLASASVLPMNIQGWFPLGLTGLISYQSKEPLRVFSKFECSKSSVLSLLFGPTLTSTHDYWRHHSWVYGPLLAEWCLCFLICCLGLSELFFQGASSF